MPPRLLQKVKIIYRVTATQLRSVPQTHGGCHMDLGFGLIDADNHYYEPLDACTRHLEKEFRRRGVQVVHDGPRT